MEIERKFLLRSLPPNWKRAPNSLIRQGYFPLRGKQVEIRLREKGAQHFITVKAGRGRVRLEQEIPISKKCLQALWPLVRGASITKRRYRIPFARHTIEMDVYQGPHRGLV